MVLTLAERLVILNERISRVSSACQKSTGIVYLNILRPFPPTFRIYYHFMISYSSATDE